MNNDLTRSQHAVKQAYLINQREQMFDQYRKSDATERAAIIRQIDSFLSVIPKEAKIFWLKFRYQLERLNEGQKLKSKKFWCEFRCDSKKRRYRNASELLKTLNTDYKI